MKQIYRLLLLIFSIGFFSCDFVKDARENTIAQNNTNTEGKVYRNVLVEDYTGHKCGNCPAAAIELKRIYEYYPGKVIPLAVHAGFFAYTNVLYPTDLQSADGTIYDNTFGISAVGNPNGLINRVGFGTSNFIQPYTSWQSGVDTMVSQEAWFKIDISNVFNSASGNLSTSIKVIPLRNITGNFNLSVLISEDSLLGEQLDYSLPSGQQVVQNYRFDHVLRGAINSTWGDQVVNGVINSNDTVVKLYSNINLSAIATRPAKCHVVAFVYDADNNSSRRYEVFQAEEKKVIVP